jgi:lipopolysaccharide transport system permease protein
MIGLGWSLLQPIAMTIIFCVVFSTLFRREIRVFAPYLLSGLVFWGFISGSAMQGCQSFFMGEPYIRHHRAPLAIHSLRVVLGVKIHFLLGMAVVLMLVWSLNGFGNSFKLISLLPTIALLLILGWSLAVCLGVVNVLFQDTQHLVGVVLQMLFYLTPIMYPDDMLRKRNLGWLIDVNPMAAFLELVRSPILHNQLPSLGSLTMACATTVVAVGAASLALRWAERRIILYL